MEHFTFTAPFMLLLCASRNGLLVLSFILTISNVWEQYMCRP